MNEGPESSKSCTKGKFRGCERGAAKLDLGLAKARCWRPARRARCWRPARRVGVAELSLAGLGYGCWGRCNWPSCHVRVSPVRASGSRRGFLAFGAAFLWVSLLDCSIAQLRQRRALLTALGVGLRERHTFENKPAGTPSKTYLWGASVLKKSAHQINNGIRG